MISRLLIIGALAALTALGVNAQSARLSETDTEYLRQQEDTLAFLAYAMLHDSTAEERFLACRELIPGLVESLKRPSSFQYDYARLGQHVSIQYPADSSFRILTWQLHVNRDEYRYYGAIQINSEDLQLFPLIDRSFELPEEGLEQLELTPDRWYGNVVYQIQDVETAAGETYYLLYGADSYEAYRRRKILDVLHFRAGQPVFGKPVFAATPDRLARHRILLEYSAAVSVTLRYDTDLEQIMMDHLIMVDGPHDEGPVFVPDGSYEAYRLENDGSWSHLEKVFHHTFEVAPREQPVNGSSRERDLFGRPRGR